MDITEKVLRALHNTPENPHGFARVSFSHTDINNQVWVLEFRYQEGKLCITKIRPLPVIQDCFPKEPNLDYISEAFHPHLDIKHIQDNLPQWMVTELTEKNSTA
jgi:hypothetical protein